MKIVLELKELYKLIPETRPLESTNFSNLKNLLTSVIEKIEFSGKWEFIQYISGNPSLFIIKQKELKVINQTVQEQYDPFNSLYEINKPYNNESVQHIKKSVKKQNDPVETEDIKNVETNEPSNLFNKTDLPWYGKSLTKF